MQPSSLSDAYAVYRELSYHQERCQGYKADECPACMGAQLLNRQMHSAHADGNHKVDLLDGMQLNRRSRYEGKEGSICVEDK